MLSEHLQEGIHYFLAVFRNRIRIRILLVPHSIWAWVPDPYSESGFRIQMSKNRFKKPKFTMTDFKDKNRKMLRLSWNFNHSFLSLVQELITLGNFILSHTVKKLSHRMEIFWWLCYCITLSHYKSTTKRRKSYFLSKKNKNYFFYKFAKAGSRIRDPYWDFRLNPDPD